TPRARSPGSCAIRPISTLSCLVLFWRGIGHEPQAAFDGRSHPVGQGGANHRAAAGADARRAGPRTGELRADAGGVGEAPAQSGGCRAAAFPAGDPGEGGRTSPAPYRETDSTK